MMVGRRGAAVAFLFAASMAMGPSLGPVVALGETGRVVDETLPVPFEGAMAFWDDRARPDVGCPGGCAYVLGGYGPSYRDAILRFDPVAGALTDTGHRLAVETCCGDVVWTGAVAYLFELNTLWRYDPVDGSVVQLDVTFPYPAWSARMVWVGSVLEPSCAAGCLYLFGGGYDGTYYDSILRIDVATLGLEVLEEHLPRTFYRGEAALVVSASCPTGCVHLIGGIYAPGGSPIMVYDLASGMVRDGPLLVGGLDGLSAHAVPGGILIVGGAYTHRVLSYPVDHGVLAPLPPLAEPSAYHASVWTGDSAWLFGGYVPNERLDRIQVWGLHGILPNP